MERLPGRRGRPHGRGPMGGGIGHVRGSALCFGYCNAVSVAPPIVSGTAPHRKRVSRVCPARLRMKPNRRKPARRDLRSHLELRYAAPRPLTYRSRYREASSLMRGPAVPMLALAALVATDAPTLA